MTDTQKLLAKAEEARLAYEEAQTKAAAQAAIEKAEAERREIEFYVAQIPSLAEGQKIIAAAGAEWREAARTGDLQTAYAAWLALQKTWTELAAWSRLVHSKLTGIEPQRRDLRQRIKLLDGKVARLRGNLNRGVHRTERAAVELRLRQQEEEAAKLRQRLEQLDSYDLSALGHAMPEHGMGDFSEDLQQALGQVAKDAAAAYIRERTVDLRAKVSK